MMKLPVLLVLCMSGSFLEIGASQDYSQLTQQQKNNKLFRVLYDTPNDYKSIELLKSQGAKVDRSALANLVLCEDAQHFKQIFPHDESPERFQVQSEFKFAYSNIEIMKTLAVDRRFDIHSHPGKELADQIMLNALQHGYKDTVVLLCYMGKDVVMQNEYRNNDIYYAQAFVQNARNSRFPSNERIALAEEIAAIIGTPIEHLSIWMTPEQREEFAAIKAKRNENQLQFVLNRQMGPTYTMHQQQLHERRTRVASNKPASEHTT